MIYATSVGILQPLNLIAFFPGVPTNTCAKNPRPKGPAPPPAEGSPPQRPWRFSRPAAPPPPRAPPGLARRLPGEPTLGPVSVGTSFGVFVLSPTVPKGKMERQVWGWKSREEHTTSKSNMATLRSQKRQRQGAFGWAYAGKRPLPPWLKRE